jgi:hypothetical protein
MSETREPGFYWVKVTDHWVIAQWKFNSWWFIADDISCGDEYIEEIDESKLERGK